ncbi:HAUS augmin-like complex subunit 4 [Littorina saxatilis]|uniref:HAUS augmin-like complex subunit 4 n=1 Tax=Littorina saxatilis TaxID=31220 RepID=A0AAN9BZ51_9CAEN
MSSTPRKLSVQFLTQNTDKLPPRLPVTLSAKEAEENPQFVSLLQQLGQLLTSDAVSVEVHKDLQQAEETLRQEKQGWLQSHILHRELQEVILDYDLRSRDTSLSTADKEFKDILEQCLNYAEAGDYLSFTPDPSSKVSLLGLTPGDIHENNPYKKYIPSMQQKLIPELEDRMRRRCENFVSIFHTPTLTDSSSLALAKASQLPGMVERSLRVLEEEKQQLKDTRERREKQFWVYFQTLLDSLGMLEQNVKEYRLGKQSRNNNITAESHAARCDAMCLKIRYVEMQILCDTYTAETVAALKKIKQEIKGASERKEKDRDRVNLALRAYTSVGYGFDELAEEYGRLKQELENKEFALKQIALTS